MDDHDTTKSHISYDPSIVNEQEELARQYAMDAIRRASASSKTSSTNTEELMNAVGQGVQEFKPDSRSSASSDKTPGNRVSQVRVISPAASMDSEKEAIRAMMAETEPGDRQLPDNFTEAQPSLNTLPKEGSRPGSASSSQDLSEVSADVLAYRHDSSESSHGMTATEFDRATEYCRSNPNDVTFKTFRSILNNDHLDSEQVWKILNMSNLLDQKGQLATLNKSLHRYMTENKSMDEDIAKLNEQCKAQAKQADDDNKQTVNETLRQISEEKTRVLSENDALKQQKIANSRITLKNDDLKDECEEVELEIEHLKRKITRLGDKIGRIDEQIVDTQKIIEDLKPKQVLLSKAYDKEKEEHKLILSKIIRARKRAGCDEPEENAHKVHPGLEKVLADYRKKVTSEKDNILKKDVLELREELAIQKAESERFDQKLRELNRMSEQLTHEEYEIESSLRWIELQTAEVSKRIEDNRQRYDKEDAVLSNKIAIAEARNESLSGEYERAYVYAKKVMLKEEGDKERLDDELKKMALMLCMKNDNKEVKKIQERRKSLRSGSVASLSSKGSRSSRGSRR